MKDHENTPQRTDAPRHQATYVTPRLVVYGALADITRAVGSSSNMDGGAAAGMMMSQA
jgi:hypothetical protein